MKLLITLLGAGALVYLGLGFMLWSMQERMVFLPHMPGRALEATPANLGIPYQEVELLTEDGVQIHGWHIPSANRRATVLFFHGNAGNISHRLASIATFLELGLDVLIIDYRGYGRSGGEPSEDGIYRDAMAAWRHLVDERGIPPNEIVIFGRSLGGAAAVSLASRVDPAALIVESALTSAADLARRIYPLFPTRLLLRLRFPVRNLIEQAPCPVLVVHARQDEIIPFAMGEQLHEAAPEPKSFLALTGDHNSAFLTDREHYVAGLRSFLGAHLGSR